MEGEGATEFKDIEGGGLGQGEGVKDVSDQIESEDQVFVQYRCMFVVHASVYTCDLKKKRERRKSEIFSVESCRLGY